jgi:hypothetical protein
MASAVATNKIFSTHAILAGRFASATGGALGAVVDMSLFENFSATAMAAALTGDGITKVEIIASATDNGASPEVIKDSGTVAADAVGDHVNLECTAEEIRQIGVEEGKNLRYVAVRVTAANAADVVAYTYIRTGARFQKSGLTPATAIS